MIRSSALAARALVACCVTAATFAACSSSDSGKSSGKNRNGPGDGTRDGGRDSSSGPVTVDDAGPIFNIDAAQPGAITLTPATADLVVDPGGAAVTQQFTLNGASGDSVRRWRVTNPDLGFVDESGLFTPSGTVGGEADIEVTVGDVKYTAHVTVTVRDRQNGGVASNTDAGPRSGGLGGVGGEGEGGAVTDDIVAVLEGTPEADASVKWLYPYDKTVFPLGILPPLLQWSPGAHGQFDGVYVHIAGGAFYDYKGFFGRPTALAGGADFIRHPIPHAVWEAATKSAAGSTVTVELVFSAGGKAYGPIAETWNIALAPFRGKVFYQSYATAFVENEPETAIWGGRFGGATLSIKVGDESPSLVAGADSDNKDGCRVCHSVSAYGDRMVAQHGGDYAATSSYDLKNGNAEAQPYQNGTVGWAGLYPDGTIGLANSIDVTGSNSNDGDTKLYDMATGAVIPSPGLNEFATRIALPAFSHDGKHAVFTLYAGPSTPEVGPADSRKLVAMDFDLPTNTFSNPRLLWQTTDQEQRPSFVTFFPSSDAVVFQRRFRGSNDDELSTWYGARGDLWWVDLATQTATPLDQLNGKGYVQRAANEHDADELLNYEPSISPVASGGYAWVVFMSRRLYGNVATSGPWDSDPRQHDIRVDITTKKLWMAALNLNPKPGEDPSHPAFYIPGQEIQGVNSRPFFALEPCLSDRGTCSTGIDCCSGFCRDGYCSPPPENSCSRNDEKCEFDSDCCDTRASCIGGFCALFVQ